MKRIFQTIIAAGAILLIAGSGGCYYDKEEILYPASACDTTAVTYSQTVTGILSARCYVCHNTTSAAASGAGIQLDGYNKLKVYVDNGRLVGAITHAGGFSPMPKNATKLSNCDIARIQAWIRNGAPNN